MTAAVLLIVLVIIGLVGLIGYLVARIVRGDRSYEQLPLLAEVGVRVEGVLTCPVCASSSFESSSRSSRGFFAFAFGPFVLGSLSESGGKVVECAVCTTRFRRGGHQRAPLASH